MKHGKLGVVWTSHPGAPIQVREPALACAPNGNERGELQRRAWVLQAAYRLQAGGVSINRIRLFLCEQGRWLLRELINAHLSMHCGATRRWKRALRPTMLELRRRGVSAYRIACFFCLPPTEVCALVREVGE